MFAEERTRLPVVSHDYMITVCLCVCLTVFGAANIGETFTVSIIDIAQRSLILITMMQSAAMCGRERGIQQLNVVCVWM